MDACPVFDSEAQRAADTKTQAPEGLLDPSEWPVHPPVVLDRPSDLDCDNQDDPVVKRWKTLAEILSDAEDAYYQDY